MLLKGTFFNQAAVVAPDLRWPLAVIGPQLQKYLSKNQQGLHLASITTNSISVSTVIPNLVHFANWTFLPVWCFRRRTLVRGLRCFTSRPLETDLSHSRQRKDAEASGGLWDVGVLKTTQPPRVPTTGVPPPTIWRGIAIIYSHFLDSFFKSTVYYSLCEVFWNKVNL